MCMYREMIDMMGVTKGKGRKSYLAGKAGRHNQSASDWDTE